MAEQEIIETCRQCTGSGKVVDEFASQHLVFGYVQKRCDLCVGKGKVMVKTLMARGAFNDYMIRRSGLPRDVMELIHDLCYHVESRGIEGYVKRAQRILSVDGCGSPVTRVSVQNTPCPFPQGSEDAEQWRKGWQAEADGIKEA